MLMFFQCACGSRHSDCWNECIHIVCLAQRSMTNQNNEHIVCKSVRNASAHLNILCESDSANRAISMYTKCELEVLRPEVGMLLFVQLGMHEVAIRNS